MAAVACGLSGGWLVQRRMAAPLADDRFHLPGTQTLDRKLIGGAILFGAGWGLAGLCPGPAIASLAVNFSAVVLFVIAMLGGMFIHRLTAK